MDAAPAMIRARDDMPPNTRRGGDVRALLTPKTAGATSGFMGVARIAPGDWISEHYHPYSEEFVYVIQGSLIAHLDGVPAAIHAGDGLMIPIDVRHRLINTGAESAEIVFHLGPLAPRPELGHVDTEERGDPGDPPPPANASTASEQAPA